ncbi:MAG: hypothetical protein JSW43_11405 [Gemmatimonadota bacterium]|nr:MAG: hypothetical protein JSW43_11405 [Gemmatimonadota bacterium]
MSRNTPRAIALAGVMLVTACARVPQAEVDAATAAFDAARVAEAEIYALDAYRSAAAALEAMRAELDEQAELSPFARNYDSTLVLAAAARVAGDSALAAATEQKEFAREDALAALDVAKGDLVELRAMVDRAPSRRGAPDPAALRSEAGTIERTLATADSLLSAGRYSAAKEDVVAAQQQMLQLRSQLTQPTRPRRG